MRSMTRAAFAMLLLGFLFEFLGFVLPWWFARGDDRDNGIYWGLMYGVACINDNCDADDSILKEKNVFALAGTDTGVELEAISITAIIAFVFCLFAVILASAFQFGMCGVKRSYFSFILGCHICAIISVLLCAVAVILAGVALGDFFEILDVQNAFEFPWGVFFFGLGGLCLAISIILYTIILSHWKRYRHIYSKDRYYFEKPDGPPMNGVDRDYNHSYYPKDSIRRSRYIPRDYYDDLRRDYLDFYDKHMYRDNYYRRSPRPYDRRYRKSYYDRYRGTRYDAPWHTKVDDIIDEANMMRMSRRGYGYDRY